jgi:hypothetical protein
VMKHRNSHFAVGYWGRLRGGRKAPDQADIDPRALKNLLPFVFLLDARPPEDPVFRLAGTSLCQRYGGELRGRGFLSHWDPASRARLAEVLRQALSQCVPVCLASVGATEDCRMVEIETMLLPMTFGSDVPERFLGVAQVLTDVAALSGRYISFERLVASSLVHEGEVPMRVVPPAPPHRTPRSPAPRRAPHLRLVTGNSANPDSLRFDLDEIRRRMSAASPAAGQAPKD